MGARSARRRGRLSLAPSHSHEPKPARKPRPRIGVPTGTKKAAALELIAEDGAGAVRLAGAGVDTMGLHVTGLVLVERADQAGSLMARMAGDNPAVFAAMQAVGKAAPYYELGQLAGAVVVAVGVDMGAAKHDSFLAQALKVTEPAERVMAALEDQAREAAMAENGIGSLAGFDVAPPPPGA